MPVFPAAGTFYLGELTLVRDGSMTVVRGPGSGDRTLPADPDVIREFVSEDPSGRYRPLPGARSLPRDWQVACAGVSELEAVLDAIYPLAPAHITQWRAGSLRIVPLAEVLARQTARYAVSNDLPAAGRSAAAEALCGRCVRVPVWCRPSAAPPLDDVVQAIPCPEPCSVLVSLCREAVLWEKNMPSSVTVDPAVPFADFEASGNEVREECLVLMGAAGEPQHG